MALDEAISIDLFRIGRIVKKIPRPYFWPNTQNAKSAICQSQIDENQQLGAVRFLSGISEMSYILF